MSLTLQLEDLGRAHVYADLDNHISLSMKTTPDTDLPPMPSGILIHFEIVTSENGQRKFHVYTSSTLATPQPNNYTTPMSVDPEAMQNTLDLSFMSGFPMDATMNSGLGFLGTAPSPSFTQDLDFNRISTGSMMDSSLFQNLTLPSTSGTSPASTSDSSTLFDMAGNDRIHFPLSSDTSVGDGASPVSERSESCGPEPTTSSGATRPKRKQTTGASRPRRLNCLVEGCERRFMSEYTRSMHMGTHGHKPRFACQMGCSETFSRQHDRIRHETSKHGRQSGGMCNKCRRVFSSPEARDKHRCPNAANAPAATGTRWVEPDAS